MLVPILLQICDLLYITCDCHSERHSFIFSHVNLLHHTTCVHKGKLSKRDNYTPTCQIDAYFTYGDENRVKPA
uniref:Secreted protein n=1 Tax=Kalanchoe fedtschenkoi TaxID=63787 RepID=A0A7N0VEQ6_KALFE